jgi:hypothetical protein
VNFVNFGRGKGVPGQPIVDPHRPNRHPGEGRDFSVPAHGKRRLKPQPPPG